jgi:hypothetical protein
MIMNKTDQYSFLLKPSTIQNAGVGVFVAHDIDSGTELELIPKSKRGGLFELPLLETVPKNDDKVRAAHVISQFEHFAISYEDKWLVPSYFNCQPVLNYLNHSESPNIKRESPSEMPVWGDSISFYALRDLKKGEELFIDYRTLTPHDRDLPGY